MRRAGLVGFSLAGALPGLRSAGPRSAAVTAATLTADRVDAYVKIVVGAAVVLFVAGVLGLWFTRKGRRKGSGE